MNVERKKYCVNGEWLESKTQTYMPVTDSSTGEVIAEVPCYTKRRGGISHCSSTERISPVVSSFSQSKNTDDVQMEKYSP